MRSPGNLYAEPAARSAREPSGSSDATGTPEENTMNSGPKIRVEDLTKVYGTDRRAMFGLFRKATGRSQASGALNRAVALSGVSLSVNQGEIVVLMGLSGSGKSTLLRSINRLVTPDGGRVYIDGEDILRASEVRLRELRLTKVSMVFQHYGLFPHRTVAENVAYGLKLQKRSPAECGRRVSETLAMVGLAQWAAHKPSSLSGGMKQRVGLARALATDAEILLMDEPFSALDPLTRRGMQNELLELRRRLNKTIVFVTHDVNEALKLGDRIAVLREGAVAQFGPPQELLALPADSYVRGLMQDANPLQFLRAAMLARQTPSLTLGQKLDPDALQSLRSRDAKRIFVLGPLGEPVGFVEQEHFDRLVPLQGADAAQFMRTQFRAVARSTPIGDFADPYGKDEVFAVVDEMGRFQGVVEPADVAATIRHAGAPPGARADAAEARVGTS